MEQVRHQFRTLYRLLELRQPSDPEARAAASSITPAQTRVQSAAPSPPRPGGHHRDHPPESRGCSRSCFRKGQGVALVLRIRMRSSSSSASGHPVAWPIHEGRSNQSLGSR